MFPGHGFLCSISASVLAPSSDGRPSPHHGEMAMEALLTFPLGSSPCREEHLLLLLHLTGCKLATRASEKAMC